MPYGFHHVHLKAPDPEKTANWYVKAFDFRIVADRVQPSGARALRCETPDGVLVNISGARSGEKLGKGNAGTHFGLEHIGVTVDDLDAEIRRLKGLGATLLDGPTDSPTGSRIAFIKGPDDVRIELVQPG